MTVKSLLAIGFTWIALISGRAWGNSLDAYYSGDFERAYSDFRAEIRREEYPAMVLAQKLRFLDDLASRLEKLDFTEYEKALREFQKQPSAGDLRPRLEERIKAVHDFLKSPDPGVREAEARIAQCQKTGDKACLLVWNIFSENRASRKNADSEWAFAAGKLKSALFRSGAFYLRLYILDERARNPENLREAWLLLSREMGTSSAEGLSPREEEILNDLKEEILKKAPQLKLK